MFFGEVACNLPWRQKLKLGGFGYFLDALSKNVEYMDLVLVCALGERFWCMTNTFHFPQIGEMTLTPEDFTMIMGLTLGDPWLEMDLSIS